MLTLKEIEGKKIGLAIDKKVRPLMELFKQEKDEFYYIILRDNKLYSIYKDKEEYLPHWKMSNDPLYDDLIHASIDKELPRFFSMKIWGFFS